MDWLSWYAAHDAAWDRHVEKVLSEWRYAAELWRADLLPKE